MYKSRVRIAYGSHGELATQIADCIIWFNTCVNVKRVSYRILKHMRSRHWMGKRIKEEAERRTFIVPWCSRGVKKEVVGLTCSNSRSVGRHGTDILPRDCAPYHCHRPWLNGRMAGGGAAAWYRVMMTVITIQHFIHFLQRLISSIILSEILAFNQSCFHFLQTLVVKWLVQVWRRQLCH